jgi:hypothetical protein
VNFTREPIIETIISPKDGHKLLVRNSKGENFEEYYVDAVEVVSFGRAFFFRSMERPKAFLVPASDYEILEVKETRVALKNVSHEKNIKIGGGREASMRPSHREAKEAPSLPTEEELPAVQPTSEETALETAIESRMERKRDRRRHRRGRRGHEERERGREREAEPKAEASSEEAEDPSQEEGKGSSLFSTLIPPPPTLISETLSRYREKEPHEHKEHEEEEKAPPPPPPDEDFSDSDSSPLHRVPVKDPAIQEVSTFNATYFIPIPGGNDPFF